MQQNTACTLGAAAVAGIDAVSSDVNAIRVGHAHTQAAVCQQMRYQSHRRGLAIGAGHCNDRDPPVLSALEHAGDDGFAYGPPFAKRRAQVHAQARRCVHFDNASAQFFDGPQNAVAHEVDATNIQAHHMGGCHRTGGHLRVYVVSDIGGRATG